MIHVELLTICEIDIQFYYSACAYPVVKASFIENNAIKIVAVSAEESKIDSIKNNAVADLLAAKPADDNPNVEQPKEPVEKQMSELFETTTLKTKGEVDQYIEKLKSRYPEGFDTKRANNREANDV